MISVNELAKPLVQELKDKRHALRIKVEQFPNGATCIDAGIDCAGGLEAGRIISEICMGGLGKVTFYHSTAVGDWPLSLHVHTSHPVLACLASQCAGWSLSHKKFRALGSGPGRAIAVKESLFEKLDYKDECDTAIFVLEVDELPPVELIDEVAEVCNLSPAALTFIFTPASSIAGCVQVAARSLEVALHKTSELGFPLDNVLDGSGSAPLSPPIPGTVKAMGRTNDAILFASRVQLFVHGDDAAAEKLALELPSSTSRDYGKPFAQIFKDYKYNFFEIDPMLFSPAFVMVTAVESGNTFRAGKMDLDILNKSFS